MEITPNILTITNVVVDLQIPIAAGFTDVQLPWRMGGYSNIAAHMDFDAGEANTQIEITLLWNGNFDTTLDQTTTPPTIQIATIRTPVLVLGLTPLVVPIRNPGAADILSLRFSDVGGTGETLTELTMAISATANGVGA